MCRAGGAAHLRRARLRRASSARRARTTTSCSRRPTTSATRSPRPISPCRGRAGRSGSSQRRERPRSSCRTRTRRPTIRRSTRATSSAAAGRSSSRTARSTVSPRSSPSCLRRPSGSRRMRDAMLDLARPDAAEAIADELVRACRGTQVSPHKPLVGRRLYFVGIGGSGMSAYANVARALGAEVRGWDVRETIFMRDARRDRRRPRRRAAAPRRVGGRRLDRRTGSASTGRRARRSSQSSSPRSRRSSSTGAHGKTTTAAMIAFALRETGQRSRLDHRRRRAAARRQRGDGRRLARRRGRRVRPLGLRAAPADRGRHEHRARSPRARTPPRPSSREAIEAWLARRARRRPRLGARAGRLRARCPGRAQPAERRRGARGARAGRRRT